MAGAGKRKPQAFNEQAIPVLSSELDVFLESLGGNMCAIGVKADYGAALDVAAIQAAVERNGGHLTAVRETHLYAWANAAAIREIKALPGIEIVTPYRNWTDPDSPPVRTMPRPDANTMRPGPQ